MPIYVWITMKMCIFGGGCGFCGVIAPTGRCICNSFFFFCSCFFMVKLLVKFRLSCFCHHILSYYHLQILWGPV